MFACWAPLTWRIESLKKCTLFKGVTLRTSSYIALSCDCDQTKKTVSLTITIMAKTEMGVEKVLTMLRMMGLRMRMTTMTVMMKMIMTAMH